MSSSVAIAPSATGDVSQTGPTNTAAGVTLGPSTLFGNATQIGNNSTEGATVAPSQAETGNASASGSLYGNAASGAGTGSGGNAGSPTAGMSLTEWGVLGAGGIVVLGLLVYGYFKNKKVA